MSTQTAAQALARNRAFLLFIIALFVLPLILAGLLAERWQPGGTSNHGELLDPAQPVPYLRLQLADGQRLDETFLQGRWTLMYMEKAQECRELCQNGLYQIRQVRLALGKDMFRTQTLFVMAEQPDADLQGWLDREHGTMTRGVADTPTLDFFAKAFPDSATGGGNWIYLIDPLGNLFMRYNVEDKPKGILDDLRHLLKLSTIG